MVEKDGKCDEPAKKKPKTSNYTKLFLDKLREFVSDSAQGVSRVLLLEPTIIIITLSGIVAHFAG